MEERADSSRRRAWLWTVLPAVLAVIFAAVWLAHSSRGHHPRPGPPPKGAGRHPPGPGKSSNGGRPSATQPQPLGIPGRWRLVFNSNFKTHGLDTSVWHAGWFGSGITGPINANEIACYSSSNATAKRGIGLLLRVAQAPSRCAGQDRPYTGALLSSNPYDGRSGGGYTYRYGVLEAKVYLPATTRGRIANWPSVLALGQVWKRDGEDDVMENLQGLVCSHFHNPSYPPAADLGGCDPAVTAGWHVVSADWEPGSITWYYDGIEIARAARGITSARMYIVLVNTVSARAPALARAAVMRVAYVRVWQRPRPAGRRR